MESRTKGTMILHYKRQILRLSRLSGRSLWQHPNGKRFRFAVVDLDKGKDYPLSFVCLLPVRVSSNGSKASKLSEFFRDRSLEVAKDLMTDALKREDDVAVRGEIERRLRILNPHGLWRRNVFYVVEYFRLILGND